MKSKSKLHTSNTMAQNIRYHSELAEWGYNVGILGQSKTETMEQAQNPVVPCLMSKGPEGSVLPAVLPAAHTRPLSPWAALPSRHPKGLSLPLSWDFSTMSVMFIASHCCPLGPPCRGFPAIYLGSAALLNHSEAAVSMSGSTLGMEPGPCL